MTTFANIAFCYGIGYLLQYRCLFGLRKLIVNLVYRLSLIIMSELINIHQAKTQLSKLLSRVALGEEFTIANRGVPVAKLVPCTPPESKGDRIPGRLAGQIQMSDDFKEPDEEMIDLFYGDE